MFLFASIRRKMVVGFSLVLAMLGALALCDLYALNSYRSVIDELEYSLQAVPRQADLTSAIAKMFEPLQLDLVRKPDAIAFQKEEFNTARTACQAEIESFMRKLERLPPTQTVSSTLPLTSSLLQEMLLRVESLEPSERGWEPLEVTRQVAELQTIALRIPDYQEGLLEALRKTRQVYHTLIWTNALIMGIVVVVFAGLVGSSYRLVFGPIRRLHCGAARVAQGDFDHRIAVDSRDEMGQLAESFNQMTIRFQEIKRDLDHQVNERSQQLVRSERLAGIGFLAAGVAHEINNPLSAIVMASESVSARIREMFQGCDHPDQEVVNDYLEMIRRESFRCRQITNRLLDFARGQSGERMKHDVVQLVGEVIAMVGHMSRYRDRKVLFERTEPCHISVNGPEVKQVVLNLIANALESMTNGGQLDIHLLERTDHIVLEFRDDGCGMTEDVMKHLFEPFFTQRKSGKGTGLGLSISDRIVSEHGGRIEVESAGPGCGSTFRVRLPREAPVDSAAA